MPDSSRSAETSSAISSIVAGSLTTVVSPCPRLGVDALGFFDHAFEVEARARRLRRASAEGEPTPFIFKQRGDGCGQRVGVGDWYYRACESVLDYLARALGRRRNDGHAAGQRLG